MKLFTTKPAVITLAIIATVATAESSPSSVDNNELPMATSLDSVEDESQPCPGMLDDSELPDFPFFDMPPMPGFPDLSSLFPEYMHESLPNIPTISMATSHFPEMPEMPQLPQGVLDFIHQTGVPNALTEMHTAVRDPLNDMLNSLMTSFHPTSISVVRVVHRPEYVPHECFHDVVESCPQELMDADEEETNMCMIVHFNDYEQECQSLLREQPKIEATMKDLGLWKEPVVVVSANNAQVPVVPEAPLNVAAAAASEKQQVVAESSESNTSLIFLILGGSGLIACSIIGGAMILKRRRERQDYQALEANESYDDYA